ncbi:MAG TPA: S9 family peptidase [Steroidobacteraceae bacterium]|nr:S9 family peptidase [Steroidobacteraceae bacterium]
MPRFRSAQFVAGCSLLVLVMAPFAFAAAADRLTARDVFALEWAEDPQISTDGERIVYARGYMDLNADVRRSNLWILDSDGGAHRPLTTGPTRDTSPRWSPDGQRIAYVSSDGNGQPQIFVRWIESGATTQVAQLTEAPSDLAWSPDGNLLAFTMPVPATRTPLDVELPQPPEGATWAEPPRVIDKLVYRFDGKGFLPDAWVQVFVVPAEGGTPRQLTDGPFDHNDGLAWLPDGRGLLVGGNRREGAEYEPLESDIYEVPLDGGPPRQLTDRAGPDRNPVVSPDGKRIAYLGFDDRRQGYQVTRLYVMNRDGSDPRLLTGALDRDIEAPSWVRNGRALVFQYADRGVGRLAEVSLDGKVRDIATGGGGADLGRPYEGFSFSVSADGGIAFTISDPLRPADVATVGRKGEIRRLTRLNEDVLAHRELGAVEEITATSSADGRPIQGWIIKPPGFDPERRYPLILEIHGGPFAAYGPHFSAEAQLFASAGYVVLYTNPRGSTSYGEEFGNLIHHAYPGQDYDDLMSAVDAVLARGYVDPERLYVTGGSGGGVLTAWIVGKTDRFRAAVSSKPVINWTSFALTADATNFFYKYWFDAPPWETPQKYWERSPLSLVGNVRTPTMLLTGEEDYRTPISESEQFYQALRLRKVDSMLVRIPGASHSIAARPSQLAAKVLYILAWFERYGGPPTAAISPAP